MMKVFVGLLILCVLHCALATEKESKEFNIKLGESSSVTITNKNGYSCTFTWNCNGGSSEIWQIEIEEDKNVVTCYIGRPGPSSYLLFSDFSASMGGSKLKRITVEDVSGRQLTFGNDWQITQDNTVVPMKKSDHKQLSLIILETSKTSNSNKKKKTEL